MKSLRQLIIMTMVIVLKTHCLDFTWTGAGGDNLWSNSANWNQGTLVPGPADDVYFTGTSNSTMDQDFTVNSIQSVSSYSGQLSLASNTLTINYQIDLTQFTQPINAESAKLNFLAGTGFLYTSRSQKVRSISTAGVLNILGQDKDSSLVVLDTLGLLGVTTLSDISLFADVGVFSNQGTIASINSSSELFLAADTIVSIGSLDIPTTFYKKSQFIPAATYMQSLTLSTQGFADTAVYTLDTGAIQIQGDFLLEIDSLQKFPLMVKSDSTNLNIQGNWVSKSLKDPAYDEIFIQLKQSDVTCFGDIQLFDLSLDNGAIMDSGATLLHFGFNKSISIENGSRVANYFGTMLLNGNVNFAQGDIYIRGTSIFSLSPGAILDIGNSASLHINDSTTIQVQGLLQGDGDLILETDSPIELGNTVSVRTSFNRVSATIPSIVFTKLVQVKMTSNSFQQVIAVESGTVEFLGGFLVTNFVESNITHILDFATNDPIVRVKKKFAFSNQDDNTEPIFLWSSQAYILDCDTIDFSNIDSSYSTNATFIIEGNSKTKIFPSLDTMAQFQITTTDAVEIEGRGLLTRNWTQNAGILNLNGFDISVSQDMSIDGDSTTLMSLEGSNVRVENDLSLIGKVNSPIKIQSQNPHSISAGGTISANWARIQNSHITAPKVGDAVSSENLGGNLAWNFSIPTNLSLSKDYINDGAVAPWNIGAIIVEDLKDALGNDTYTYEFSNLVSPIENAFFTIQADSLYFAQMPDVQIDSIYPVGLKVTDQTGAFFEDTFYVRVRDSSIFVISTIDSLVQVQVFDYDSQRFSSSEAHLKDTLQVYQGNQIHLNYSLADSIHIRTIDTILENPGIVKLQRLEELPNGLVFRMVHVVNVNILVKTNQPTLKRAWYLTNTNQFVTSDSILQESVQGLEEVWLDFEGMSYIVSQDSIKVVFVDGQDLECEYIRYDSRLRIKLKGFEKIRDRVDMKIHLGLGVVYEATIFPSKTASKIKVLSGRSNSSWDNKDLLNVDGSLKVNGENWGVWYVR